MSFLVCLSSASLSSGRAKLGGAVLGQIWTLGHIIQAAQTVCVYSSTGHRVLPGTGASPLGADLLNSPDLSPECLCVTTGALPPLLAGRRLTKSVVGGKLPDLLERLKGHHNPVLVAVDGQQPGRQLLMGEAEVRNCLPEALRHLILRAQSHPEETFCTSDPAGPRAHSLGAGTVPNPAQSARDLQDLDTRSVTPLP